MPSLSFSLSGSGSTLLVLLAPFLLPKVFIWLQKLLQRVLSSKSRNGPAGVATPSTQIPRPQQLAQTSRLSTFARWAAAVILFTHSLLSITLWRPFNIFGSLEDIPLTTSSAKLTSMLDWHGVSDRYGHILPHLTSLDSRLLYDHFGQDTFLGCQGLCSPTAAFDFLIFHAVHVLKRYALAALLLGLINQRGKIWFGALVAAGYAAEVASLATTEIRLGGQQHLADQLYFYRYCGFLALLTAGVLLPSKTFSAQLPQRELQLLSSVQAALQQQDLLQIRLRMLEACKANGSESNSEARKDVQPSPAMLSQERQLKEWLSAILAQPGHTGSAKVESLQTSQSQLPQQATAPVKPEGSGKSVPVVEHEAESVLAESPDLARTREIRSLDESPAASTSFSSPASSPLETPTPANNPPPRFNIFAVQLQKMAEKETATGSGKPASAEEVFLDTPVGAALKAREMPSIAHATQESILQDSIPQEAMPQAIPRFSFTQPTPEHRPPSNDKDQSAEMPHLAVQGEEASSVSLNQTSDVDLESNEAPVQSAVERSEPEETTGPQDYSNAEYTDSESAQPLNLTETAVSRAREEATTEQDPPRRPMQTITNLYHKRSQSLGTPTTHRSMEVADQDGWTTVSSKSKKNRWKGFLNRA